MTKEQNTYRLNLIRILQKKGWSQKSLAQKTGIAQSEISRIINANIPLTVERIATICSAIDIEANEFFRTDIIVENEWEYIKVRLASERPPAPKPKRQRKPHYEKLEYRFTERQMKEFASKLYLRGYNDGRHSDAKPYTLPEEESYKVAEDILLKNEIHTHAKAFPEVKK